MIPLSRYNAPMGRRKQHDAPLWKRSAADWRRVQLRRKLLTLLCALAIIAALVGADRLGWLGQPPQADPARYHEKTFRVVNVVDGDTLDIDVPDGDHVRTRIRLQGVDTPETVKPNHPVEPFGPEASTFTRRATLDKSCRIEVIANQTRDKFGRLLAYVYLPDGTMLNEVLIQNGLGYADPRFDHPHKIRFAQAMKAARAAGVGLWANTPPHLPYYLRR